MQLSDRITGSALVAVGAAAVFFGSRLPGVPGQQVGPSVFPIVVGTALALCGALIAFGIGRSFEEDAAAVGEEPGAEIAPPRRNPLLVLLPPALLVAYVLVVDRLGFLLSAAIMILVLAVTLGARLRIAIPIAIAAPLFISFVFGKLLRVWLPTGLIGPPW